MFTCRMKALLMLLLLSAGFLVTSCGGYVPGPDGGDGYTVPTQPPPTFTGPVTATLSGTVTACSDQNCSTSQPLPGATVTLTKHYVQGSYQIATTTADGSGNYSFQPLEFSTDQGTSYSVSAAGTDASGTNYTGNTPIPSEGFFGSPSSITINIQVFPA